MTASWRYLLIMKSLPSEYRALTRLEAEVASSVTPLIQLWDRTPNPEVEEDGEGPDEDPTNQGPQSQQGLWGDDPGSAVWDRLRRELLDKVRTIWPSEQPVILDGGWLTNSLAFAAVLNHCRAFGRKPLPVTGLTRPAAYQEVVAAATAKDREGLVLRLERSDFGRDDETLAGRIDRLLASLGASIETTDLILDLRSVDRQFRERDELVAESMMRSVPHLDRWRNLALAASSMPRDGRGYDQNDITPFDRVEWWIWLELRSRGAIVGRIPVFADYGVIHPDRVETITAPKSLPRIPQIRYAVRDQSLMIRGRDLRKEDASHLRLLLQRLTEGSDWSGSAFSAGDAWIDKAARGLDGPGDWGTWKRVGQVHHVTHVSRQIATMFDQ
jgi:hypothetical protein